MADLTPLVHLCADGTSVLVSLDQSRACVAWWGEEMPSSVAAAWGSASSPAVAIPLVPLVSQGWAGTPGASLSRGGLPLSPALSLVRSAHPDDRHLLATYADPATGVKIDHRLAIAAGVVTAQVGIANTGQDDLIVHRLDVCLPLPASQTEILDTTSRSHREKHLQRHRFTLGRHEQRNEVSRGSRGTAFHGCCEPGATWERGRAHLVHVAWSGAVASCLERGPAGGAWVSAGEVLEPGEIRLQPGERYDAPLVIGSWGDGLDAVASRFHAYVRSLPSHPRGPRPVGLNSWEAVYFDHSLDRITALLDRAERVGVERFVLDDGWFGARRDDTAGLGDWVVSPDVWPQGLAPVAEAARARGMQFGLWVEPEMVNLDSDLARAHPEWICATPDHLPVPARHQYPLNLTIPAAWQQVRDQIAHLVGELHIDYLKWDFNRELLEVFDRTTGHPVRHELVLATYRMMDALHEEFDWLEIESCASGGERTDLGVIARTQRIWPSDCIDPLERLDVMDGTRMLLPPELCGTHIASPVSHTTGRQSTLSFRAIVALFGHVGIEWDLSTCSDAELDALAEWVDIAKRFRELVGTGTLRHGIPDGDHVRCFGVVAPERDEALYAIVAAASADQAARGSLRLPGLDESRTYAVTGILGPDPEPSRRGFRPPAWWGTGVAVPGWILTHELTLPGLNPEQAALIHLQEIR